MTALEDGRMRLLLLDETFPTRDPDHENGISLITWEILTRLPDDVVVDLVCFAPAPGLVPETIRERCRNVRVLTLRPKSVLAAFSNSSRSAWRRTSREARRTVRAMSSLVDVTMLIGPQTLALARDVRGPLVVHEVDPLVDHVLQAARGQGLVRRAASYELARRHLAMEQAAARRAAAYLLVNPRDAARHSERLGREVIGVTNGVTLPPGQHHEQTATPGDRAPRIGFVGSLAWAPNQESVRFLLDDFLPALQRDVPDVRLVLAGRRPPPWLSRVAERPDVIFMPDFESADLVFAEMDVAVFPPQRGFGIRNSVLDALAHGVPVVAASSSARGLPPGEHLQVADDLDDLLGCVKAELGREPSERRRRVLAALKDLPTWDDAVGQYVQVLSRHRTGDRPHPGTSLPQH